MKDTNLFHSIAYFLAYMDHHQYKKSIDIKSGWPALEWSELEMLKSPVARGVYISRSEVGVGGAFGPLHMRQGTRCYK